MKSLSKLGVAPTDSLRLFLHDAFTNLKFMLANVPIEHLFDEYIASLKHAAMTASGTLIEAMDKANDGDDVSRDITDALSPYHEVFKVYMFVYQGLLKSLRRSLLATNRSTVRATKNYPTIERLSD